MKFRKGVASDHIIQRKQAHIQVARKLVHRLHDLASCVSCLIFGLEERVDSITDILDSSVDCVEWIVWNSNQRLSITITAKNRRKNGCYCWVTRRLLQRFIVFQNYVWLVAVWNHRNIFLATFDKIQSVWYFTGFRRYNAEITIYIVRLLINFIELLLNRFCSTEKRRTILFFITKEHTIKNHHTSASWFLIPTIKFVIWKQHSYAAAYCSEAKNSKQEYWIYLLIFRIDELLSETAFERTENKNVAYDSSH